MPCAFSGRCKLLCALQVITMGDHHPLTFGREVLAELVSKPERADWRSCQVHPAAYVPSLVSSKVPLTAASCYRCLAGSGLQCFAIEC